VVTFRYELYGLVIDSDRPLYVGNIEPNAGRPADVVIRHAPTELASRLPRGDELLLHYRHPEFSYFCERSEDGSFSLVFTDACEFQISADLRQVTVHRHSGALDGIEDVLAAGAQMAWQLYMRGSLVLHGSAVETERGAVAFIGNSGMGKSTMATLMCAAGGKVITDDLLRVDFIDDVPVVRLGSSELRLRKGADTLSESFDSAPGRRSSADHRQLLQPQGAAQDRVPLRAIFVPVPERDETRVRIDRIRATDAIFAVMKFPRLLGWLDPSVRERQFQLLSQLARSVGLSIAYVPWGPPFSDEIPAAILAEIGRAREGRRLDLSLS